jgi:hypothetical protein
MAKPRRITVERIKDWTAGNPAGWKRLLQSMETPSSFPERTSAATRKELRLPSRRKDLIFLIGRSGAWKSAGCDSRV